MTPTLGWIMTLVAVAAIVTIVVLWRRGSPQPVVPVLRETVDVFVDRCDALNLSIRVEPWHVNVRRGRPLEWNFHGPDGSTLTVVPKSQWPFEDTPKPPQAPPGRPIRTGRSNQTAPGGPHKYSLKVECEGRTYDIDPDVYFFY